MSSRTASTASTADLEIDSQRLIEVLAQLSASFIDLPPHGFDDVVSTSLRKVAELIHADRGTLAQVDERGVVRVSHSWNRHGVRAPRQPYDENALPWIASHMRRGEPVWFERRDEIPEEMPDRRIAEIEGIRSHISFPLSNGQTWVGVMSMANIGEERPWPPSLRDQLQLLADIFAVGLQRKMIDREREEAVREASRLTEHLEMENRLLRQALEGEGGHERIIGRSSRLKEVLSQARKLALESSPVLILGETGTGKEGIADLIHALSPRASRPMVKVNCASLPPTLIESELFGREKGAFTGAATREPGRFEAASGSTLLLDEIGDLTPELQSKLLRVLEEGEFERLGSSKTIRVDVRVIASTNRDLRSLVQQGAFRKDLFYRLDVVAITVPPLRDRPEDIPLLVWTFVEEFGLAMGRRVDSIPDSTMDRLVAHPWPGNVRELRNVIERAMILDTDGVLEIEIPRGPASDHLVAQTLDEVQREQILRVLDHTSWRIRGTKGAAEILGVLPTTLESRMKRLGIRRAAPREKI